MRRSSNKKQDKIFMIWIIAFFLLGCTFSQFRSFCGQQKELSKTATGTYCTDIETEGKLGVTSASFFTISVLITFAYIINIYK
jgi:hypothetical protein